MLAKAVLRAATQLGMNQSELGAVIGMHRTAVSRLGRGGALDPDSKQGELALLLIRLARALHALTGGDSAWMRHFMCSENAVTGGVPVQQITTIQGLITVLTFIDGIRGKL
ncbi:MAG: antitoxin Xre-like helix-turn-helix domain-containing protein [Chromatocurvus sp.]